MLRFPYSPLVPIYTPEWVREDNEVPLSNKTTRR